MDNNLEHQLLKDWTKWSSIKHPPECNTHFNFRKKTTDILKHLSMWKSTIFINNVNLNPTYMNTCSGCCFQFNEFREACIYELRVALSFWHLILFVFYKCLVKKENHLASVMLSINICLLVIVKYIHNTLKFSCFFSLLSQIDLIIDAKFLP